VQRNHITRAAGGVGGGPPDGGFVYLGTHEYSSVSETTKTFTFDIGAAYASKNLVMVNTSATSGGFAYITAAFVAGVSMSLLDDSTDGVRLELLSCPIGAIGGDQTVTITTNSPFNKGFISFYSVDSNVFSMAAPATVGTTNQGTSNNAVLTGLTAGSLAIGGACSLENNAGLTIGGIDTDFSGQNAGPIALTFRSGSLSPTGTSVTLTYTSTSSNVVRVLGAFAPI